ncbi:glutathione S-transferase T3-like [Brassica napus]|uniref:glutathione S-transferase T3-like n=1 Tax=Brassica napus TaxID=3708 RepID=UPI0006AB1917|nr:glutathione S-transferase T3-like [Brassica napus]
MFSCSGDQKVAKLDKIVGVLTKKTSVINYGLAKGVSVLVLVILVIVMGWKSFRGFKHQCQNSRWGWQSAVQPTVESANKERRKWSPNEDKILVGAWLNTSKDPVVSCDQKAERFWKRIVDYYNASPQLVGTVPIELGPAKQRWARINEQVCKFVGCYEAALRGQRSGQNEDDVMKAALDSFFNIYEHKFSLEHAWRELRHDQKWCTTYMVKDGGKEKRKPVVDVDTEDDVAEPESRPVGVKAAKAAGKRKKSGKEEEMSQLQSIMEMKEKLSKQKILERLLAKKDPLSEMEESLKLKLMTEML